jgi:amidohydrolase
MELIELKHKVEALARKFYPEIVEIRRHLHMQPELSKQEEKTSQHITSLLQEWEIPYRDKIGGNGVLGELVFTNPVNRVIALRADMDALPIKEQNEVPYKSRVQGVMHACGHDVHMASLLGVARILMELRDELQGTVKLIFQPSEEQYPGGAIGMISEGVLEDPRPDLIIGQHVYPELEAGMTGMRGGFYMASTDEIFITVRGKGGHAATPHRVVDPVLVIAHIVVALQQIVSRNANPTTPSVISFGKVCADGRTNIIPDEARLEGVMRTFDEEWREEMKSRITAMATSIAKGMGAECEVFIDKGYPAVYNDPAATDRARKYAVEYLGESNVADLDQRMTAEDFSYYQQQVPGVFYRLGIMNKEKGITSNLHTSTFDVDESSLITGMGTMAWIAIRELLAGKE